MPPIDTRQNRPPPVISKELCDAPQARIPASDGRRNAGDSRFSDSASGGWPKWDTRASSTAESDDDQDTAETGRNPQAGEDGIPAIEQARAARKR